MENLSLVAISKLPEQRSAVLWKQAQEALATYPEEQLQRETDGESHYVMTPPQKLQDYRFPRELQSLEFSIAAIVNSAKSKEIPANSPTYLIINGNVMRPIIQFDKYSPDSVTLLGIDGGVLADDKIEDVVATIRQSAENAQAAKERRERDRHSKAKTFGKTVGALALLGGIGYGAFVGIDGWVQARHDAARQKVEQFDARHILLPGQMIGTGETGFAGSDPALLGGYVPGLDNQVVAGPREFEVDSGKCKIVASVPKETHVVAASDAPAENVVISVNSSGNIQACALAKDDTNSSSSNSTKTYKVAIQTRAAG